MTVYSQAVALADEVWDAARQWPTFDRWTTGTQLVRAADSVGANIAEAFGRHKGDQRRFLYVARGSAHETEHWVDRALARGLVTNPGLAARAHEVGRMLNGLIRNLDPK
ncbi:MAG TPA: four helix bundle protein [Solirubrobacterales bacterium]|nr:four helix bundle protein [Solirubrobacterales bacterium]